MEASLGDFHRFVFRVTQVVKQKFNYLISLSYLPVNICQLFQQLGGKSPALMRIVFEPPQANLLE